MNLAIENTNPIWIQCLFKYYCFYSIYIHLSNFIGECFSSDIYVYKYYYKG